MYVLWKVKMKVFNKHKIYIKYSTDKAMDNYKLSEQASL